jgi:ribosome maturation factor RimP
MDGSQLEQIRKSVLPYLNNVAVELVDLLLVRERGRLVLRFLVDRDGGITLGECAQLNREIGRILDQENIIQQRYILEVSSPGLDRALLNTADFQRVKGQLLKVILHQAVNRQNVWTGILDVVNDKYLILHTEQGLRIRIARENIAHAKLEIKIDK